MGLDFIRSQDKQFTQLRDESKIQELDVGDLLTASKGDAFIPLFRCQLTDSETTLVEGLALVGRAFSETRVRILQRGKDIGYMLEEDALELTRLMKENHCHHGVITLITEHLASFDGIFAVKSKTPFKPSK